MRGDNPTQHKTTQVQQETTQVQPGGNTSTEWDNRSTKQPKIYFDLFVSLLHAQSLVY